MKYYLLRYIVLTSVIIIFSSCFKDDLNKISDEYIWEPDVSVPIFEDTYLLTDTRLSGSIETNYPNLNIKYIPISKDFELNFINIFEDVEYIKSLELNLGVENYCPSEILIFIDFMKYPSVFIKSLDLDEQIIIPAAITDSNGDVSQSQSYTQLIPIDIEDNILINETEFIRLEIRLINREISDEIIENLDNYFCNCSIGLKADLKIPIN